MNQTIAHAINNYLGLSETFIYSYLPNLKRYKPIGLNNEDSEGGAPTNNKEWAEKVQMYGLQGLSKGAWHRYSDRGFKHYQVIFPGYKYNMMDIQAALGIHKLKLVNKYHKIREKIWKKRDQAFQVLPLMVPAPAEKNTVHALHLYTPLLDIDKIRISRDTFRQALHNENIGAVIHSWHYICIHIMQIPLYLSAVIFPMPNLSRTERFPCRFRQS